MADYDAPVPATETSRMGTVVRHVELAATLGLLIGIGDGAWSALLLGKSPYEGALFGAGLLGLAAALLGVLQGLLVVLVRAVLRRVGVLPTPPAFTTQERERQRHRIATQHAWVATVVLVGAACVGGFNLLLIASERVKEVALRSDVLVMAVGGAVVVMAVAVALVVPWLTRLFVAIDRRWGLPRPRSKLVRYLFFVAIPAGLLLLRMFTEYGVKLGVLATPFGAVLFGLGQHLLWRIREELPEGWLPRATRRHLVVVSLWGAVIALAAASNLFFYARWAPATEVANGGEVMPAAAEGLQRLTDVDRDGISSLFGGSDCAPFDSRRSPANKDIPNNGVDEDCNGQDATEAAGLPPLAPFHGGLRAAQTKPFNVLFLVIDSLRADHLSGFGYAQKTSPHLDELGKESWVFTHAYSQASTTALSMPSMLSGRRPDSLRWQGGYPKTDDGEPSLPALLRSRGYDTTLAVNQYVKRHLTGMQRPFERVISVPNGVDWKSGEYIISDIITSVDHARDAKKPFFITAHFDDVHHPYRAYLGRALPTFTGKSADEMAYDRCIANMDNMLRPLMSHLRNIGVWDDTILIITSDHGEEFKEHGNTIHSQACYIESVHVPLIVRVPGFKPQRVDERVALTDIAPTVMEAIGLPSDALPLDGQSLFVPVLTPALTTPSRPIFCSIFQLLGGRKNFFTRSVRDNHWALVHEALADRVELFDITRDPREQNNVAPAHPDVVSELQALLKASATGNLFEARRFQ